jgi:hypothetical protein
MADDEGNLIDRTGWPAGPWDDEPDTVRWTLAVGLLGLIGRNALGAFCGYVGLPPGHPLHGFASGAFGFVRVHGGVTFTAPYAADGRVYWLVGFDCLHCFDDAPGMWVPGLGRSLMPGRGQYRDLQYVRAEVESLGRQLVGVDAPKNALRANPGDE